MSKKQSNNNAINCLEGLIDSIVGNTDRSDKSRLVKLAEHMIKHSFFFSKDAVDERHIVTLILYLIVKTLVIGINTNAVLPTHDRQCGRS